jgi:hypothetical protein
MLKRDSIVLFQIMLLQTLPVNDLDLFKIIYKYKKVNAIIAEAAIENNIFLKISQLLENIYA